MNDQKISYIGHYKIRDNVIQLYYNENARYVMATSLLQIRVEDSLKDKATQVFDNLGIDTSIAVRMFLKHAVMENGIPFAMTLPKSSYIADRGYKAMLEIGESAEKSGLSDLSLEEISAEIDATRQERREKGK